MTNLKGFKFAWRDLIKEFLYTAVLRFSTLFGEYLTLTVTVHVYIELLRFGYDVAILVHMMHWILQSLSVLS